MLNIETPQQQKSFALFNLGFRPFFLLAGIHAVIAMLLWMGIYISGLTLLPANYSSIQWHGHEMIFGFAVAVASGFLLTAVRNWTNVQTLNGYGLMALALLWLGARILPFTGSSNSLLIATILDLLFISWLVVAISQPIIKAKQWTQLSIVSKIVLLGISNLIFYLGLLGILSPIYIQWGLYSGLYLIISLIMLMGRRVIPFFIEKGVDGNADIKNWKWLDISSLILFLAFIFVDVFITQPLFSSLLAAVLFVLHSIRLWGWYAHGIWKKPLIWVLYIGYAFIVLGFALIALQHWFSLSPWIALHAFAAGGIGIVTTGMMSRVALGHTGRNVFKPPAALNVIFLLLLLAALLRVVLPLAAPALHQWWIILSQLSWIAGFSIFVAIYAPMLIKPRIDGRFG